MSLSICCLVLYAVFIEFAYFCTCDLFDSIIFEIFHEVNSMLMDHVCTNSISELDHCYVVILFSEECCCFASNHSAAYNQYFLSCCSLTIKEIGAVNDRRIIDTFDRKDQCSGTGSNDYAVWLFFFNKIQSYFLIHLDCYACFLAANDIAADHVCDVAFSRRISCKTHVSAKFVT